MIDGFEPIRECPVSAISAEARESVAQFERINFAREATGTTMYGHLADWPASEVEASIALTSEENRLANAKVRSESAHTNRPQAVAEEE